MKRGLVVGELWATRKAPGLVGRRLKLVVESPVSNTAPLTVAIDTLDARNGQEVLIAYGSGARNVLEPGPRNHHVLCDAAIALLVDAPAADSTPPADREPGD